MPTTKRAYQVISTGNDTYNQAAYDSAVNRLKEVVAGTRGWISLTAESKACGVPKAQLSTIARALGLTIQNGHGRNGMTATR